MDSKGKGGSSTRVLAVAIVIAILGVTVGGYYALKPTPSAVTMTSTIPGPATTVTSTTTAATIVTVSEGVQQAKVTTISVGGANYASDPEGMAFDTANNMVYVALENTSSVAVINATSDSLVTTISLATGDSPVALAYDAANNMVYVANNNGACTKPTVPTCSIPVINAATNSVATTISTDDTTNGMAILPATNTVLATSNDDDAVFVINGVTNTYAGELQNHTQVPDNSQSIAVDTKTGNVFDGNWYHKRTAAQLGFMTSSPSTSKCLFANTNTSAICETKALGINGGKIDGVAVDSNTGMIYLANINANSVNVISEATGKDVANITVPSPAGITANPDSNLIYVASNSTSSNALVVISGSTNAILGTVPVGTAPANVVVDTNTNVIFVSNAKDGTVSAIDGTSLLF